MKSLRKYPLITVIFLSAWLWTTFSYSMQAACCCFPQNKCKCSEKRYAERLSLGHNNHQEVKNHHQKVNHCYPEDTRNHQGENPCHQDDNHCSCIKCGNSDTEEAVLKIYLTGKEKNQVLTLEQNILEKSVLLKENIAVHLDNKTPLKFLSLFLLNSSFLI